MTDILQVMPKFFDVAKLAFSSTKCIKSCVANIKEKAQNNSHDALLKDLSNISFNIASSMTKSDEFFSTIQKPIDKIITGTIQTATDYYADKKGATSTIFSIVEILGDFKDLMKLIKNQDKPLSLDQELFDFQKNIIESSLNTISTILNEICSYSYRKNKADHTAANEETDETILIDEYSSANKASYSSTEHVDYINNMTHVTETPIAEL